MHRNRRLLTCRLPKHGDLARRPRSGCLAYRGPTRSCSGTRPCPPRCRSAAARATESARRGSPRGPHAAGGTRPTPAPTWRPSGTNCRWRASAAKPPTARSSTWATDRGRAGAGARRPAGGGRACGCAHEPKDAGRSAAAAGIAAVAMRALAEHLGETGGLRRQQGAELLSKRPVD